MFEKLDMLYEGKAKKIYATTDENTVVIHYKDDATAFNGEKKAQIDEKGKLNNEISSLIYDFLGKNGIKTHFKEKLNSQEQLCERVEIIPLEVIVRNKIAGSMARRLNIKEGTEIPNVIYELSYKDDDLNDPLINDHHAVAIGAANYEELEELYSITEKTNMLLKSLFEKCKIDLIDFKLEFGKDKDGNILLADEISPDTCRFWDVETGQKLDKDRFRKDLGNIKEAYIEILKRLGE